MLVETRNATEGLGHRAFPCFDGLRALAALSVFVYHSATVLRLEDPDAFSPGVFNWLDRLGFFGVAVFFVISGFLLYRPYAAAAFAGRPPPRLLPFWKRRFARIFPAYWAALAFVVVVFGHYQFTSIGHGLSFVTLTQNYRSTYAQRGLGLAWTLVVEVSFYVALPGIAWVLRRLRGLRGQLIGLGAMAALGLAAHAFWLWTNQPAPDPGAFFQLAELDRWLPSYLDWFALGMAMAVASAYGARLKVPAWVAWTGALACYWVVVALNLDPLLDNATYDPLDAFVRWVFTGLAGALFVLPAVFGERGAIRRLLTTRVLVGLGLISYGIYLWHLPLWHEAPSWSWFPSPMLAQVAVVLALTLTAATISYRLIERPINRWARRSPKAVPVGRIGSSHE